MPPREGIKTYVPQPQRTGPSTERGDHVERHRIPTLIRWFIWLLIFRSAMSLVFALTIGLAPDSDVSTFIATNFDAWPKQMPAEGCVLRERISLRSDGVAMGQPRLEGAMGGDVHVRGDGGENACELRS